jgi:hypothetical protein
MVKKILTEAKINALRQEMQSKRRPKINSLRGLRG